MILQERRCRYEVTLRRRSYNHCLGGKAISVTYSECVFVALGIQHVIPMRHIFVCALPLSTVFFHISHKRKNFSEYVIEHKKCFDFLYEICLENFLILRRNERDMIKNVCRSSGKVAVIL